MRDLFVKTYKEYIKLENPLYEVIAFNLAVEATNMKYTMSMFKRCTNPDLRICQKDNADKLVEFVSNNMEEFKSNLNTALAATIPNNFVENTLYPSKEESCFIYKKLLNYYQSANPKQPLNQAMNYYIKMLLEYEIDLLSADFSKQTKNTEI